MFSNIIKRYDFTGFKSHIKNTNSINKAGLSSSCLLTIIALFAILPFVPHMDGAEARKNEAIHSTSTISVTTGQASAKLNLVPGTTAGIFATSSAEDLAKFTVISNSHTGYTLSVTAGDDYGELTTDDSNNETKFNTIDSIISESTFRDNPNYNGYWGFKPSKYNSSANTDYLPSPTASSPVMLDNTNGNGGAGESNEYTIALGARANNSFQYGTYKKTFNLVAVGNPPAYNITFADNSGDPTVDGIPAPINRTTQPTSNDYVTLPDTEPTRDGFNFGGWCSLETDPSTGACPNDADIYNHGENFYFDETKDNVQTLYAIWTEESYGITVTFAGEGIESVQVRTAAGRSGGDLIGVIENSGDTIGNLNFNTGYYLYPIFTSPLYKLVNWAKTSAVGNISSTTDLNPVFTIGAGENSARITGRIITMQEFGNLDGLERNEAIVNMETSTPYILKDTRDNEEYTIAKLGDGNIWMLDNLRLGGSEAIPLTPADTNINSNWTLPASGTACFSQGSCTGTNGATGTGFTVPAINTTYKDIPVTNYGAGSNKVGTYYNYCAVTAGTYCMSSSTVTDGDATSDICPVGWRMPNFKSNTDYYKLVNYIYTEHSATNNKSLQYNLSTPFSGYFENGSTIGHNTEGEFWASSRVDATRAYFLRVTNSEAASYAADRYTGNSVRCMLNSNTELSSLQYFNTIDSTEKASIIASMEVNRNYTFVDNRDGQKYTVAKLKDGNVWMTQNLNLGAISLTAALDYKNTNLDRNRNVSYSRFNEYNKTTSTWPTDYTHGGFVIMSGIDQPSGDHYSILYNYYAASAETIQGTSVSTNAEYDLCPAGWRMPTGGPSGEFVTLSNQYNSYDQITAPVSSGGAAFVNSGRYPGASGNNYSYYWSSTRGNNTNMNVLYLDPRGAPVGYGMTVDRKMGGAIRCLLK